MYSFKHLLIMGVKAESSRDVYYLGSYSFILFKKRELNSNTMVNFLAIFMVIALHLGTNVNPVD